MKAICDICQKCKEQSVYFAQFCPGVEKWTCGVCNEARKEAAKRYVAKYGIGGSYNANGIA